MAFAVPAAGFEIADAAALLLVLLGWAVALGLLWIWRHTLSYVFQEIASLLTFNIHLPLGVHFTINLGGWATSIDNTAQNFLSAWALGADIMAGRMFHALAWVFTATASEIAHLSQDTLALGHWLTQQAIPDAIAAATSRLHSLVRVIRTDVHTVETRVVHVTKTIEVTAGHAAAVAVPRVAIPYVGSWRWLHTHWAALRRLVLSEGKIAAAVALPGIAELPIPHGLTWRNIRRRLSRLEVLLGATGFAVAMANVLGIGSWRCLTKGPIGRVSRALCGLGSQALNDLLSLLVDVFIVTDLCEVLSLLDDAVPYVIGPIDGIIDAFDMVASPCNWAAPPVLALPALYLPPTVGAALYLA
jgi:hypothetical protein